MTRKRTPENKNSQRGNARGRSPIPWKYCLLTLVCGTVLVVGFFLAARQHFASIDFGIKNSKLRKQIENLESDKRRFILAKEIALSPGEIKKAAQKLGFREMSASNIEVYQPAGETKETIKTPSENSKPKHAPEPVEAKKDEKKESKKPEKDIKKDGVKTEKKVSDAKEKSKPQTAKK